MTITDRDRETLNTILTHATFGLTPNLLAAVEEMVRRGEHWNAIGKRINWDPATVCEHYYWRQMAERDAEIGRLRSQIAAMTASHRGKRC